MTVAKYKHRFTKIGIRVFEDLTTADIFNELEKENGEVPTFKITIGRHEMEIPNTADNYEDLILFLEETLQKEEEEEEC